MEVADEISTDFFAHEPSKAEKIEMRKAVKKPSAWLNLLCKEWAEANTEISNATDTKFLEYKPFMKGMLSSQLLCRLSNSTPTLTQSTTFWETLGILDEFDRSYIIAQIERFCFLYNILGDSLEDTTGIFGADLTNPLLDPNKDLASPSSKIQTTNASRAVTEHDSAEIERRFSKTNEHQRMNRKRNEQKSIEREALAAHRITKRSKREEIRMEREKHIREEKEAALRRAADLVRSNRVPLEITRGAAAAQVAASVALQAVGITTEQGPERKKSRSAVIISTAGDLHRIVTYSKNLWAKYNAIAKEHNQTVNWSTVAKELGIHVKVREKYARMHAKAEQKGFDWVKNADWLIKDHPEYFLEHSPQEHRRKFPSTITTRRKTASTFHIQQNKELTASAAVDATITPLPIETVVQNTDKQTSVAAANQYIRYQHQSQYSRRPKLPTTPTTTTKTATDAAVADSAAVPRPIEAAIAAAIKDRTTVADPTRTKTASPYAAVADAAAVPSPIEGAIAAAVKDRTMADPTAKEKAMAAAVAAATRVADPIITCACCKNSMHFLLRKIT